MARSVLILDDDEDLRVTLADVLSALCGVDAVAVADVASMIREDERALACELAILDINLGHGQPSGIDAHAWLTSHGFAGRIVLLTGHASTYPLVQRASELTGVQILRKPVDARTLCGLLEGATP